MTLCPNCRPWAATSEHQLVTRERNRKAFPEVRVHQCMDCGSADWASTRECIEAVPGKPFPIIVVASILIGVVAALMMLSVFSLRFKPVSVESSVMREEEFQEHIAHMNRFPRRKLIASEPYKEPELTLLQTVALLKMNPSTLSRGVAARMLALEGCQDFPCYRDYQELARHKYAEKPEGVKWHELTAFGRARADTITRDKCFELKIHSFISYGNAGRYEQTFRCACMQWTAIRRRSPHAESNAYTRWLDHVSTAEGMDGLVDALKPPVKETA